MSHFYADSQTWATPLTAGLKRNVQLHSQSAYRSIVLDGRLLLFCALAWLHWSLTIFYMLPLNLPASFSASSVRQSIIRRRIVSPGTTYSPTSQDGSEEIESNGIHEAGNSKRQKLATVSSGNSYEHFDQPTVTLVQRKSPSIASTASDNQPNNFSSRSRHPRHKSQNEDEFTPIHLTPRPDIAPRGLSSSTQATRVSNISRLPTPDFAAPPQEASTVLNVIHSFRGGSGSPLGVQSGVTHPENRLSTGCREDKDWYRQPGHDVCNPIYAIASNQHLRVIDFVPESPSILQSMDNEASWNDPHPELMNTDSSTLTRVSMDANTAYLTHFSNTVSFDTGQTGLLRSISTTNKFTHKWPRPQSMRRMPGRKNTVQRKYSKVPTSAHEFADNIGDASEIGLGFEGFDHWTIPKWSLVISVTSVFGYGVSALIYSILTWYQTWLHADVMVVADNDVLILITLCAILMLGTSLVGATGALLNSRPILAVYSILLWPTLCSLLSVGYVSYKRSAFALDRKLNLAWSQWYTDLGRRVIQDALNCCGFYDATHEASFSPRCYARTPLPGCKGPLLRFERNNLSTIWATAFSVFPLHLINIFVALLCSNHVTNTFGKGLTPKRYRLRVEDVRMDAHALLTQLAGASRFPPVARAGSSLSYIRDDKEARSITVEQM